MYWKTSNNNFDEEFFKQGHALKPGLDKAMIKLGLSCQECGEKTRIV